MSKVITWVGLDAHKASISVAMRRAGRRDFIEWTVANEPRALKRMAKKIVREAPGEVRCCYEAGPCGYGLQRELEAAASLVVDVVAPSLIPRKPGERVKTDRRDARKLCELFEAGLLTEVTTPSEQQEATRDLFRCRESARKDLMRHRHRLSKFLLRRAIRYTAGSSHWTWRHHKWLRALRFDNTVDRVVFDSLLLAMDQCEERLRALTDQLEKVAEQEPNREPVATLRCFRGVNTVTAFGLHAELLDFARFQSPRQLASFIGITPSEHSSGGKPRRGSITKTGNAHVRRLLVEAAQHYRHRPGLGTALRQRRAGQPLQVLAIADKAQHRLHRRYHRLVARGVPPNKAIVAVARELAGFLWAAMVHPERRLRDSELLHELVASERRARKA